MNPGFAIGTTLHSRRMFTFRRNTPMPHVCTPSPSQAPAPLVRCCMAAALLFPLGAYAVQDCTVNGASVNPANGNTTAGKTGIMRCVDRDTGQLMREEELRNGKSVGLERYYRDGKLEKEHSVNERGNKHGRAREFAPNGQVLRDATYDNGTEVGLVRRYDDTGRLRRATFYARPQGELAFAEFTSSGKLSDLVCDSEPRLAPEVDDARLCGFKGVSKVEFFTERHSVRARITLDGGKRTRQERLYDNGTPAQVTQLQDNRRIEQRFSDKGVKLREEQFVVAGQRSTRELEQQFSEDGKLTQEKRWRDGEPVSERRFYLNGQPKDQTLYSTENGVRQQLRSHYHDNGQLASDGRYVSVSRYRDVPVGTHRYLNEKGRQQVESTYDDKGRLTRERTWDDNGKLERDDAVFEDGSRKAYSK